MKSQLLLRAKSHKDPTKEDKYRLISLMNLDAEFFIKYLQTEFKNTSKDYRL